MYMKSSWIASWQQIQEQVNIIRNMMQETLQQVPVKHQFQILHFLQELQVDGPARLLGLESSDNSDMSHPKARQRRVYQGRLVGYVQRLGEGAITVTFSSPLLEETSVEL